VDAESKVGIYRLEVTITDGPGKLHIPSSLDPSLKESAQRAWTYLQNVKSQLGITQLLTAKDVNVEAIDLSGGHIACNCSVAFYTAFISAFQKRCVQGGTLIMGDLTIQGNIKALLSVSEPLTIAMENGARKVLLLRINPNLTVCRKK
jgi:ATP-dependent Lon protease